jgi:predicted TPR repeat methyltransferase
MINSTPYQLLGFNEINFSDPIFNSIRCDYPNFEKWKQNALISSESRSALVVQSMSGGYDGIVVLKLGEILLGKTDIGLKISIFKVAKHFEAKGIADILLSGVFEVAVTRGIDLVFTIVLPSHVDFIRYLELRGFRCAVTQPKLGELIYLVDLAHPEKNYSALNRLAYDLLANEYQQRSEIPGPSQESPKYLANILLSNLQPPIGRILELGPGSGDILAQFSVSAGETVAVEISPKMASVASLRAPNALVIIADVLDIDFAPESFDGIYAGAFLHLFPQLEARRLTRRLSQWLKPCGTLFINTSIAEKTGESTELKADYIHRVARFRSWWTEESFREILEMNGFSIIDRVTTNERERGKYWVAYVCQPIFKK